MKTARTTGLMALLTVLFGIAIAEAVPVNLSYTYLQPSEGDLQGDVEQHEMKADLAMPVLTPENDGFGLSVGAAFQMNLWRFDNDRFDDLDLYKVKAPVKATFRAREAVPVEVALVPGIHSDFKEVDEDDFRLEGSVVGTYVSSETLTFKFGLAYGEEFGDPAFFPIGGVIWKPTDELRLDLVIPAPKVSYALTDDLRVFVCGEPAGGEWNIEEGSRQVDVRQEGYRVGLGGEYQVVKGGWLYAMAGVERGRNISVEVDEDEVVDEEDIDDAAFVQVGFRLR